jgi:PhnB protein
MPIGELPWSPCAASIVDKFGVWWYLSAASHRPPEDYDYWDGKAVSKQLEDNL